MLITGLCIVLFGGCIFSVNNAFQGKTLKKFRYHLTNVKVLAQHEHYWYQFQNKSLTTVFYAGKDGDTYIFHTTRFGTLYLSAEEVEGTIFCREKYHPFPMEQE